MNQNIEEIISQLKLELKETKNLENLKILKSKYIGKSDFLNNLKEQIKVVEDKSKIGKQIKSYLSEVNEMFANKKEELSNSFFFESKENVLLKRDNLIEIKKEKGKIHPISYVTIQIHQFLEKYKYNYSHGYEVEEEKYNFDILNMPSDHPAREMQDTFFLKEKGKLLRTHATNTTARSLVESKKKEIKSYSIGPVFRNDDNDATHSFQFTQFDIFDISKMASISNLKLILDKFLSHLFEERIKTRYRLSYFPFTEPSFEVDIQCQNCKGKGKKCPTCKNTGWIEVLGSGILNNNVIKNAGKNESKLVGFAAGVGIERIAMLKWKINDIRNFYTNDLDFLKGYDK